MIPLLLYRFFRLLALLLLLGLLAIIWLIIRSNDNGPLMTPFALVVIALLTALVLTGFTGGLLERELEESQTDEDPRS